MPDSFGRPSVHGHTGGGRRTPTYLSWQSMRCRCINPSHPRYRYYGGRGITIAPAWVDFAVFLRDMGERPPGTTLDRIDNDGNYEPGNCRWATPAQQAANRRPGDLLRPNSLRGKARAAGLPYMVVYQRYKILGWSLKRALSTPKAARTPRNDCQDGRRIVADANGNPILGPRIYIERGPTTSATT